MRDIFLRQFWSAMPTSPMTPMQQIRQSRFQFQYQSMATSERLKIAALILIFMLLSRMFQTSPNEFGESGVRGGITHFLLNRGDDAVVKVVREPSQILFGRAFEQDAIHAIWIFSPKDNPRADDNAAASGALV